MFTDTLPKPLPQLVLGQTFQKEVLEKARWKQDAETKGEEEKQSMWSFQAVLDVHTEKTPPPPQHNVPAVQACSHPLPH